MEITRLLELITQRMPDAPPAAIFRMGMLVCHACEELYLADDELHLELELEQLLRDIAMKLAQHQDQHSAIAYELDSLAGTEPCQFSAQHLWMLIRAIKVQSQYLDFYLGPESISPESISPEPVEQR